MKKKKRGEEKRKRADKLSNETSSHEVWFVVKCSPVTSLTITLSGEDHKLMALMMTALLKKKKYSYEKYIR